MIFTAGAKISAQTPKTISAKAATVPAIIHLRYLTSLEADSLSSEPFLAFLEAFLPSLEPFSRLSSSILITSASSTFEAADELLDPSEEVLAAFFSSWCLSGNYFIKSIYCELFICGRILRGMEICSVSINWICFYGDF